MLLRDLLNKTWQGHEDETDLREAVGQMEAVTAYLNESKVCSLFCQPVPFSYLGHK